MATYKAVMRPALEYASSVWSPIASSTSINKLQVMQHTALRTATGCTQDTNIQHLHGETLTLPIHEHLQLHASQYKHKTQHPSHPLHKHTTYFNTPRLKNYAILNNGRYNHNTHTWKPDTVTQVLPPPRSYQLSTHDSGDYRRNNRDIVANPSTTPNRVTSPYNPNCVIPNPSVSPTPPGCNSRGSNVTQPQNGSTHDGQYVTRYGRISKPTSRYQ